MRDGIVYIGSSDEKLYALDAQTGEEFWSFKAAGRLNASPAVSDEVIGIVSQGRAVQVLDALTGRLRLDFNIAGESIAPPALDNDLIYAVDTRGAIVGIDWSKQQFHSRSWRGGFALSSMCGSSSGRFHRRRGTCGTSARAA